MAKPHPLEWIPPDNIEDIFFKCRCVLGDCAKTLNISRGCLWDHLRTNSELKAKFDKVEASLETEWVDQAEKVMWFHMAMANSRPSTSFQAAKYVLDNKGKKRGWGSEMIGNANDEKLLNDFAQFIADKRAQSSDLNISEIISSTESKS